MNKSISKIRKLSWREVKWLNFEVTRSTSIGPRIPTWALINPILLSLPLEKNVFYKRHFQKKQALIQHKILNHGNDGPFLMLSVIDLKVEQGPVAITTSGLTATRLRTQSMTSTLWAQGYFCDMYSKGLSSLDCFVTNWTMNIKLIL